jgi:hypothetical protein
MSIINISKYKFSNNIPNNLYDLSDIIYFYNNGSVWKCIPIKLMIENIFVHDIYYENGLENDMTITYSPFTNICVSYIGKYNYECKNNEIFIIDNICNNNNNKLRQIDAGISDNDCVIRRLDSFLLQFKDVITYYRDCLFYCDEVQNKNEHNINIKNICLGIDYISEKGNNKYVLLEYKNYDKLNNYIIKYSKDLKDKGALLISCSKDYWLETYKNSKIIKL